MTDGLPERIRQPTRWRCIGTFDRMDASLGLMGPGKIFVSVSGDEDQDEEPDG